MLSGVKEEFPTKDDSAAEEVKTGAESDEVVVADCLGVFETDEAGSSGACVDWTGIVLTSCVRSTATEDGDDAGVVLIACSSSVVTELGDDAGVVLTF